MSHAAITPRNCRVKASNPVGDTTREGCFAEENPVIAGPLEPVASAPASPERSVDDPGHEGAEHVSRFVTMGQKERLECPRCAAGSHAGRSRWSARLFSR